MDIIIGKSKYTYSVDSFKDGLRDGISVFFSNDLQQIISATYIKGINGASDTVHTFGDFLLQTKNNVMCGDYYLNGTKLTLEKIEDLLIQYPSSIKCEIGAIGDTGCYV